MICFYGFLVHFCEMNAQIFFSFVMVIYFKPLHFSLIFTYFSSKDFACHNMTEGVFMLEIPHYSCTCHTSTINILMAFTNLWIIPNHFHRSQSDSVKAMRLKLSNLLENFCCFTRPKNRKFKIHDAEQQIFLRIDFLSFWP